MPGVCFAQPAGITRDMIERALPVEGAPLAEPGPYKVTSEGALGSPGHREGHVARTPAYVEINTIAQVRKRWHNYSPPKEMREAPG